ncbi:MAG: flavin reductase family protein [Pseudomonadota bacterium]
MNAEAKITLSAEDIDRLKGAMGTFATGVTVVSTHDGEMDHAMTCNSFNTVSLDPPMVLWSIRQESASRDAFRNGNGYTVSVLGADAEATAMKFAVDPLETRYDDIAATRLDSGRLVLDDAVAWFDCALDQVVHAGDHDILIARVLSFQSNDAEPMVYLRGKFTRAAD